MSDYYNSLTYKRLIPFFNEPDYWKSCAYGLPFYMKRNWSKAWCGYVGVPKHHPHFELNYSDRIIADRNSILIKDQSPISIFLEAAAPEDERVSLDFLYDCPGGITWAENHAAGESPDGYWWFGFDCSHYNDLSPRDIIEEGLNNKNWRPGTYKDFKWVHGKIVHLASQLSDFISDHPETFK